MNGIPRQLRWLTCVALALAAVCHSVAQASIFVDQLWPETPAMSSDEARLLDDARDGRWDQHSLFAAALIASGANAQQQTQASANYERLRSTLLQSIAAQHSTRDRAGALLRFLHQTALREGYDLRATALHDCLATGRFNCVSATLLFNCLASELGLDVHGLGYTNHARSLVLAGGEEIEVETTCADWFRGSPNDDAFDADATAAHGQPRPLTDVSLVAMIYYNRAVEASRDHDFPAAIGLNRLALALDPAHALARANLYSAINNHALAACRSEHFADAIALIRLGLTLNPQHHPFHENLIYVYHRWLEHLAGRNETALALEVLDEAQRQAPSAPLWNNWRSRLSAAQL